MAHDPYWDRSAATPQTEVRRAGGAIACILFVGAMGAAFWIGTIWASQAW